MSHSKNTHGRFLLIAALLPVFVAARSASAIEVILRSAVAVEREPIEGTVTATSVVLEGSETQKVAASSSVPGTATIDVPNGVWRLQVSAKGWFHPGEIVSVGKEQTTFRSLVWPLGNIHGRFKAAGDGRPLSEIKARWSTSAKGVAAVPDGETSCVVTDDEYRCAVPVGTLDLKISTKGYGSHFLWRQNISLTESTELPISTFKKGSGLFGWVKASEGVRLNPQQTRVVLTASATSKSTASQSSVATINDRGFFIFTGIDPGAYRIVANVGGDVGSDETGVIVREGREIELLEPLLLERRIPLRISITPPIAASGAPWEIALSRAGQGGQQFGQATADHRGLAVIPGVGRGTYSLSLTPRGKDTAHVVRAIEMPRDANLAIEVPSTNVVGTVRMNDRPLADATLWFGGKHNSPSLSLKSDAEGYFSGVVPFAPEQSWTTTVSSTMPTIEKTIRHQPVREGENTVRIDLVLPGAMIEGVVFDANGSPATRATVNVIRADVDSDLVQAGVTADGRFEVAGLDPGDYTVYADGRGGRSSPRQIVTVSKDGIYTVKLAIGAGLQIDGRLTTEDGSPVAGARVFVNPVEVSTPIWIPRRTSQSGEFSMLLPDATRTADVLVVAPGFAFKAFRAPITAGGELVILMRQNGGSIEFTTASEDDASGRIYYVVHQGTAVPLMFFLGERLGNMKARDAQMSTVVTPHMEQGPYGLCLATKAEIVAMNQSTRCTFGNLPPFGSLSLSLSP